jgi:ABC-type nickel/cobalt efflux system permease component RcnA
MMKKVVIYLMVGILQVGLFTTVAAASPLFNDNSQRVVQLDRHDRHDRHDNERRRNHDERLRRENDRHEREMRRHHHESEREYRERQRHERERHERELRIIAALLIGIAIANR